MNEKQRLLNEDLKRFRLLMEYDFYIGEDDNEEGDLLFDDEPQGDEAPEGDAPEDGGGFDAPEGEEGGEFPEGEVDPDTEFGEELPAPEPMGDEMGGEELPPEPMEDEVELDITQLVQGTDAAKQSADQANQQISGLMAKFDELAQSLDKMDAINAKIDDIEHEIETRNPTPEEQLEMRSLDSFPYNLKLTDYWSEKEGHYDAMGENDQKEGEDSEFVLTQDEVDQDYNAIEVKDSFGSDKEREQMKY
jgi:hypothetical protein